MDYDLRPDGPPWRSSSVPEAMFTDHAEQFADGPPARAWSRVRGPVSFLRAPRGIQDEPGGLYPEPMLADWQQEHPHFDWVNVDGANHYTITLGDAGAAAVSAAIAERLPATPAASTR